MGIFSDILLTVDYDRTLTDVNAVVPERNLEAIRYFMENGGAFTVNTGRSIPMAGQFLGKVPVNAPVLLYNGSAAYDTRTGKLTFCHEIPLDLWDTMAECKKLLPGLVLEIQGLYAHYRLEENPDWDFFYESNNCPHAPAAPGQDLGPFVKFAVHTGFGGANVGHLFEDNPEEVRMVDEAERLLKERFGQFCEVFRSGSRILDIHAKGVSKGRAARELQHQLGRKILICLGDAENDLSMLEEADYAFVPSDALIADRFENLCSCNDGAVADAIYEKIPEILKKSS